MNSHFALPGIKSLAYLFTENLPTNIPMKAVSKMPVAIFAALTSIPFTGECTCVVENTNQNNGTAETATLTFRTQTVLPEHRPLAFILTDVMGQSYVLGAKEKPYAQIHSNKAFGLPDSEPRTIEYEVIYQSIKALYECSVG